jgi:hypothetical protein
MKACLLQPFRSSIPICATLIFVLALGACSDAQKVTTSQYDNARLGANRIETALTPRNVNTQYFGKIFTLKVDGDVYAQPLFLSGVEIPGKGRHDVLFIVTEHDSVYAFDAYGTPAAPLWHVSLLDKGGTPVPAGDTVCPFIAPEVGITSTPVIDAATGTLYVLARTKEHPGVLKSNYRQSLHALAITNGVEKLGGPVDIHATVSGRGEGSRGGQLAFDPWRENPRAALLLANGAVTLTWGSSCDVGPYHGWVISYDAQTLQQKAVFNASPDSDDSGFWASDTGPAADSAGNIFVATGNGLFDAAGGDHDYGDSLLQLDHQSLRLTDYFTPFNAEDLDRAEKDLGSGGPVLLPDQPGPHPHLAVIAGKSGTVFLVDRDHMGKYHPGNDSHAVQAVPNRGGVYASTAYWNHNIYVASDSNDDALQQFSVDAGRLSLKAASGASLAGLCSTPTVSANGMKDGIVWVLRSKGWNSPDTNAQLYAFDAANIGHRLYDSEQNPSRDRAGLALRFNIPIVVNGHVYIGAKREVDVYGLLPADKAGK